MKIAIIGGGASGMLSAIVAKRAGANVTVFERLDRVGKKLLSTGNGRCNITNVNVLETDENGSLAHYHGNNTDFAKTALYEFDNQALIEFFGDLGVIFRLENDKYYPYSETASTVLNALRFECDKIGVKTVVSSQIDKITKQKNGFLISGEYFDKVIIACGGQSSAHMGTDGIGYELLKSFGHKITPLYPAITQVKTDNKFTRQLKGIKCNANVVILQENKNLREEYGQILFADYGLSGPPVFQLSSYIRDRKNLWFSLDFMPEFSFNEILGTLKNCVKNTQTCENLLSPILNKKLGQVIVKYCGMTLNTKTSALSNRDLKTLANAIKNFKLQILGTKGFTNAQVTLGGAFVHDFNAGTMQSKLCKNLYACGEVLDITGDCGGYNLQWAFSSGHLAGKAAAEC
ncbi:MAG: NAD(P)/FAD-dependent oxidoreductase [Clostridia bacterium]|nr:NAD(P)/FAD-dependent oxidoreductase [Clostridia bacterium]